MAVTYPRTDVISSLGVVSQDFRLMARSQLSRQANGVSIPKRLGSSIWMGDWSSKDKKHVDAIDLEAIITSLDDGLQTFRGYDTRRPYPKLYPTGAFGDTGILFDVGVNNNAVRLSTLNNSNTFTISRGDYFCFAYGSNIALHQAMETITSNGSGTTLMFDVRPHIRPGFTLGVPVILKNPYGQFRLLPQTTKTGSVDILRSSLSISAYQYFT